MKKGYRWWLLPCCLLFFSCSLEDDRDLCCENNIVRFRYLYRGIDRFREYIHEMQYFLFDGSGYYLGEMRPLEGEMELIRIDSLEAGSYTIIGIGNLKDYAKLEGHVENGLEEFKLTVDNYFKNTNTFTNGDQLYWGKCDFTISSGTSNSFLGEMSNVHCLLHLRVEWERLPEFFEGYRFHLKKIGTGMNLDGSHAISIGEHRFPQVISYTGSMTEEVPLRRFALETSLYTLRYTDSDIPRFRLFHEDKAVSKEVDLGKVFRRWGWYPERTPVQEYEIRMLIRNDGSIEVNQGLEVGTGDWEDGGIIGF